MTKDILAATEVTINGTNAPDIQVCNDDFFGTAITESELGFGESYVAGW